MPLTPSEAQLHEALIASHEADKEVLLNAVKRIKAEAETKPHGLDARWANWAVAYLDAVITRVEVGPGF